MEERGYISRGGLRPVQPACLHKAPLLGGGATNKMGYYKKCNVNAKPAVMFINGNMDDKEHYCTKKKQKITDYIKMPWSMHRKNNDLKHKHRWSSSTASFLPYNINCHVPPTLLSLKQDIWISPGCHQWHCKTKHDSPVSPNQITGVVSICLYCVC